MKNYNFVACGNDSDSGADWILEIDEDRFKRQVIRAANSTRKYSIRGPFKLKAKPKQFRWCTPTIFNVIDIPVLERMVTDHFGKCWPFHNEKGVYIIEESDKPDYFVISEWKIGNCTKNVLNDILLALKESGIISPGKYILL